MIKVITARLLKTIKRQNGMALPAVVALLAIGGLMLVPSIDYVATSLRAGSKAVEEFKGVTAADCGVEDALWKIKYSTPASFPHSYELDDINRLSVDITIDEVDTIAGEPVGEPEHHADWLIVTANVTYNYSTGNYTYVLSATNNSTSQIKISRILLDFPAGVEYVTDSTTSNITNPEDANPTKIIGNSSTGITVVWINGTPRPNIAAGDTEYHSFLLSGPPDIEGILGYGFIEAKRSDMSTVWIGDMAPYSIIAEAENDSGEVVATIRAGVGGRRRAGIHQLLAGNTVGTLTLGCSY